jgi:hypothetical protein
VGAVTAKNVHQLILTGESISSGHSGRVVQAYRIMMLYWIFMVMAEPATMDASTRKEPKESVDTPVMP